MTVGDLRKLLKSYPDGMDVGVIDSNGTIVSAKIVEEADSELDIAYTFLVVRPAIEKESVE